MAMPRVAPMNGPLPEAAASAADHLAQLVAFNTISHRSNQALIDHVAQVLRAAGAQVTVLPDASGEKANLLARFGPAVPGGVVLSAHSDVVPVEGQPWSSDPFVLRAEGGRLYGRGAADMKGFLATILSLASDWGQTALRHPIYVAVSYDEEIGCFGVRPLIQHMLETLPPPRAVIVGEPTRMGVVTAQKGIAVLRTQVHGVEAHSSQPERGVSATMVAGRVVSLLDQMMTEARGRARTDDLFDHPYTTFHVGVIQGGQAFNIQPRLCTLDWDIRNIPDDPLPTMIEEALRRLALVESGLQERFPQAAITTQILAEVAALGPDPDPTAEELARSLTGDNTQRGVSFAAEAGFFQQAGYATVLCGPGDIAQAHQPDEFIEEAQLAAGVRFLRQLALRLC